MTSRGIQYGLGLAIVILGCCCCFLYLRVQSLEATRAQSTDPLADESRTAQPKPESAATRRPERTVETGQIENPAAPAADGKPFHWNSIESTNYESYIQNLRSIGCPETTIRDIVLADLNRSFALRRGRVLTPEPPPFWQLPPQLTSEQQLTQQAELRKLDAERVSSIRQLLGVDPGIEKLKSDTGFSYSDNRLGNLPPEKQDQVGLIREEFNDAWSQLQVSAGSSGVSPDAVSRQLRELDANRLSRLAQFLTPAEMAEEELQTSWTAIQMRQRLAGFNAMEEEFRSLYAVQKEFDDEYVHYFVANANQAALQQKADAQQRLNDEYRSILGEQRYAQYLQLGHGTLPPLSR